MTEETEQEALHAEATVLLEPLMRDGVLTVESVQRHEWGLEVDGHVDEAERDADHVLADPESVRSIDLPMEDATYRYLVIIETSVADSRKVVAVGHHTMGEYSDDEGDAYYSASFFIADPGCEDRMRAAARRSENAMMTGAITTAADALCDMMDAADPEARRVVARHASMRRMMRHLAQAA